MASYEIPMACQNCGLVDEYQIPERRWIKSAGWVFYSEEEPQQLFSAYARLNGTDYTPLVCHRCKLAALVQMPVMSGKTITLGNWDA